MSPPKKRKASEKENIVKVVSSEIKTLQFALVALGRTKGLFSNLDDVGIYNSRILPIFEKIRSELMTKKEKEKFDNGFDAFTEKLKSYEEYKYLEKFDVKKITNDSIKDELEKFIKNKDKKESTLTKFIKESGSIEQAIEYIKIITRVHIDESIIEKSNEIQKGATFFKRLRYKYPLKRITVRQKKEYDKTIQRLQIEDFGNTLDAWRKAIKKSRKDRNKHYTDKSSDILD